MSHQPPLLLLQLQQRTLRGLGLGRRRKGEESRRASQARDGVPPMACPSITLVENTSRWRSPITARASPQGPSRGRALSVPSRCRHCCCHHLFTITSDSDSPHQCTACPRRAIAETIPPPLHRFFFPCRSTSTNLSEFNSSTVVQYKVSSVFPSSCTCRHARHAACGCSSLRSPCPVAMNSGG